jgi:hypothetical protein
VLSFPQNSGFVMSTVRDLIPSEVGGTVDLASSVRSGRDPVPHGTASWLAHPQ